MTEAFYFTVVMLSFSKALRALVYIFRWSSSLKTIVAFSKMCCFSWKALTNAFDVELTGYPKASSISVRQIDFIPLDSKELRVSLKILSK